MDAKRAKMQLVPPPVAKVTPTNDLKDERADCVVFVSDFATPSGLDAVDKAVADADAIDKSATSQFAVVPSAGVAGGRMVLSNTGPVTRDYDDVRRYSDAAQKGVKRALAAGARKPLLVVHYTAKGALQDLFANHIAVAVTGALAQCYVPLEVREDKTAPTWSATTAEELFVYSLDANTAATVAAIEAARSVSRDLCGGDPERMAPPKFAAYVQELFAGSNVKVTVKEKDDFSDEYPLLEAVARCSRVVERHHPRVVNLEYTGEGPIEKTLFFVGKGITYDTGGADIKAGGIMAGMHRDKGGASSVAGFLYLVSLLKPKNIRVVGKLAVVRNSVGADAYVADEIIHSRAGVRVRVGNTDAEGRMVMADVLCEAKEEALHAPSPHIFTMATLTGHAVRAYGDGYFAAMDNGPARAANIASTIAQKGLEWGDPAEISTVRREDFSFVKKTYLTEDVLQANNAASTNTARGHQYPAAFLTIASGLDKHGINSDQPLPYTHLDIAGSTKMWPTPVSGSPIPALAATFLM
ncbi:hypothetical protein PTSG_02688 [Salpingoeca rosetta]|uniref:Cytosol aminopeptidase domain-containing protein n=1 Tax=Salpingoeca rosetta (strain ATCC 50818 / BSB-021) TaxID=946362 RepID=F2U307_SALR5|nr:uncharacterized protein PTSG_02688 [Salpingoeca rosetta]EGD82001.1 hypothetical protein PTSG_02688 [Salpingoeca rosetta]|eukprot:XP_004996184.1 hypothetical protein PTSG_02688 [Salpingoeca rosetta]